MEGKLLNEIYELCLYISSKISRTNVVWFMAQLTRKIYKANFVTKNCDWIASISHWQDERCDGFPIFTFARSLGQHTCSFFGSFNICYEYEIELHSFQKGNNKVE